MVKLPVENAFPYFDSRGREWEYFRVESECIQRLGSSYALISAYTPQQDADANKQLTDLLAEDIRAAKLKNRRILGSFLCGKTEISAEFFFIPLPAESDGQAFIGLMRTLCGQNSMLLCLPDSAECGYYGADGTLLRPADADGTPETLFAGLLAPDCTAQWLAFRHPISVPHAVWMSQHCEIF